MGKPLVVPGDPSVPDRYEIVFRGASPNNLDGITANGAYVVRDVESKRLVTVHRVMGSALADRDAAFVQARKDCHKRNRMWARAGG